MKFLSSALAGLFAVSVSAKTPSQLVKTRMDASKLNKKTLLKNARPYKNNSRKLDGNGWEITSDYSIQFSDCVSLRVKDDDLFEDFYDYAYSGQVVAQQSYVLFNVCETDNCYYSDDANLYITSLGDYMDAVMEYNKQTVERFCEACEQTCNQEQEYEEEAEEEEEGEEEEGDEEEDGEDRRLRKRRLANYVDCDECEARADECAEQEDEGDDDGDQPKDAYEWLEQLAECQETGANWNGAEVFAGFICNSEGDGVEIAVFLDEECSLYTNQQSYSNIMSDSDEQFREESEDIVINAFKETISCEDNEYDNPNEDNDDGDDDGEDEVNEFCKKVMEDDVTQLGNCGDYEDDGDEDEYNEDEDENNYDWYEYDLDDEDAEDAYAVCTFIDGLQGEYSNVYDSSSSGSGHLYDYHKNEWGSGGGSKAGKVILILLIIAAVAGGAYWWFVMRKKTKDDKAQPLTKSGGGAMA